MECPRCGEAVEIYRLGDEMSLVCPACRYVGIEAEHTPPPRRRESWDEALERFRHTQRSRQRADGAAIEAHIATLDLPGEGETLQRRREAIKAMYDILREQQTATKDELLAAVDIAETGYGSAESFWTNAGRQGLRAIPGVNAPKAGDREWRVGESALPAE